MVGQVVVVFYRLQSGFLAEETQVVDWDGCGEERGERGDHGEAGAQDGDEGDAGWGWGGCGCGVGVAEGGFVLGLLAWTRIGGVGVGSCGRGVHGVVSRCEGWVDLGMGLNVLCPLALRSELSPVLRSPPSARSRAPASAHHGYLSRPSAVVRAWPASTGGRRCGRSWEGKT